MSDEMCPKGRPATTTKRDVVAAAKEIDDPCFTVKEVAEYTTVGAPRVRDYLNELAEEGVMGMKRSGSGKVWWLAEP